MAEHLTESSALIEHRRRQRRTTITLTLVALLMLGAFALAAAYYQGGVGTQGDQDPAASPNCLRATAARDLRTTAVTINVYNGTDRAGLAGSVAKSLRSQGFKVANVANDPLGKPTGGVGEVRHGPAGVAAATLVATKLPGSKVVRDERTDGTVDLVLGSRFTALSPPSKAAPGKVGTSTPSC